MEKDKLPSPKELRNLCGNIKPEDRHWREVTARWISIRITWFFLKVFPKITPNQITVTMLIFGIISAGFFAIGTYAFTLLGVLFFMLHLIVDACDGEVARYKKLYSTRGLYLDYLGHIIVSPLVIAGIAVGAYRNPGFLSFIPNYWFLIIGFLTFYAMLMTNFFKLKKYEMWIDKDDFKKVKELRGKVKGEYSRRNWLKQEIQFFFRIMIFNSIFFFGILNLMPLLVILNGVIFPLQALKRFYSELKSA